MSKKIYEITEVNDDGKAVAKSFYVGGSSEKNVRKKTGCTTGFHSVKQLEKKDSLKMISSQKTIVKGISNKLNTISFYIESFDSKKGKKSMSDLEKMSNLSSMTIEGISFKLFKKKNRKKLNKKIMKIKKQLKKEVKYLKVLKG